MAMAWVCTAVDDGVVAAPFSTYGFGYHSLTRSEARHLENSPDAHTIRDRLLRQDLKVALSYLMPRASRRGSAADQ
jgi:hypothetical protein